MFGLWGNKGVGLGGERTMGSENVVDGYINEVILRVRVLDRRSLSNESPSGGRKRCSGCDKGLKRDNKTGYCNDCLHATKIRWHNEAAKGLQPPGYEERLAVYEKRASSGLPIFSDYDWWATNKELE